MRRLLPLACLALSGCVATQTDVLQLGGQMDTLEVEMVRLRETMESVQRNQADLVLKLERMQTDLGRFNENVGGVRDDMGSLSSRIDDLNVSLGRRITELAKSTPAAAAPTPTELFRQAQGSLMSREYDLALKGFELYLKAHPQGSLADQAVYLSGESQAGLGRHREAAVAYAKLLEGHPKSELVPAARLCYALSILKLDPAKMGDEAVRYLESVVQDFPSSPEARKAEEHLADLKKKKEKKPEPPKAKAEPKAAPKDAPKAAPKTEAPKAEAPKK